MTFIYHLAQAQDWDNAQKMGAYRADSLAFEGFIHCSFQEQLKGTLEKHFKDSQELVLLKIEIENLNAEWLKENTSGGQELFPHLYGELNLDAVSRVWPLKRPNNSPFELPETL